MSVATVMKYFGKKPGQSLSDFAAEYKQLTEQGKKDLDKGIEDGTLTY